MQVIDEGYLIEEHPSATTITINKDNTQTITTNNIDVSRTEVKVVLQTLTENKIQVNATQIESLQYTEGPKSIEYIAVIKDSTGHPYKQVTLIEDKTTKITTIVDETSLTQEIKITRPVAPEIKIVPITDYYKPEVKEIITKIETKVSHEVNISKITKIAYTNTTEATKFHFTAEDSKGHSVTIVAVQQKGESTIEVLNVQTDIATIEQTTVESKTVKTVTEYGVKVQYTTDQQTISSNQNVNVAVTSITSQHTELEGYHVVSAQLKTYVQSQEQVLIMTNGEKTVQVLGTIDLVGTGNNSNLTTPWVVSVSVPAITTAGQLRIMEIGNQAANGDAFGTGPNGSLRLFNTSGSNISVSGTVTLAAVPEPSHMAFAAFVAFIVASLVPILKGADPSEAFGPFTPAVSACTDVICST